MELNIPRTRTPRSAARAAEPDTPQGARPARAAPGSAQHWRYLRLLGVLLLLLVGGAAAYSHYLSEQLTAAVARMDAMRRTVEESRRFLNYVVDLESGHRGYLLSGDPAQLESYAMADAALPEHLALLDGLLAREPALRELLDEMRQTLARKRREMSAQLREHPPGAGQVPVIGGDLGKFEMDRLRLSTVALERALSEAAGRERRRVAHLITARSISMNTTLAFVAVIGALSMFLHMRHFDALRRQEQLQTEVARTRYQSDIKSTFLAHVSHEIRTPMNAIFGFSGLLHDRLHDPVNRRYIDAITDSARSLLSLINDLLDLSKIESGKIEIVRVPWGVREVVDGVLTMFSQQAEKKVVKLRSEIHSDVPPVLRFDGDRVRQMLVNLVSNALKYTEHGEITVRVIAEASAAPQTVTCRFEVEDSGTGIAPEELETIFEPFARGRRSGPGEPGGTGLGLSITRQLARAMGGDVGVRSVPGQGSCFSIVLPDLEISAEPPPATGGAHRLRDMPGLSVLIVDDVELNRRVLSALFQESAGEVKLADSGFAALEVLEQWVPAVALVDIRMPGMSGIELARRVRAEPRWREVRLVAVTASNVDPLSELGDLFDGIVVKPFSEAALAREISQALGYEDMLGDQNDEAPEAAPETAPADEKLIVDLEALLSGAWPAVRDTPTLSEVRQFADSVERVGRFNHNGTVTQYARKLGGAALSFDIARIEALLSEFPDRVSELRAQVGAGSHEAHSEQ